MSAEDPLHKLLTVIVPVYNTKSYLNQCLDSLLAQNLRNFEIVCVDNGSTDGSLAILNEYASRHKNIVVLNHPKGRQGDARNAGLRVAKGKYIGFVDSDDFVQPDMFSKLYSLATENNAEISICNIELFYQVKGITRKHVSGYMLESTSAYRVVDRPLLLRNLTICNKVFSSTLLERLGLRFPESVFHEDQYFVVTAMLNAHGIISTQEALYHYRKEREGSVSSDQGCHALDIFLVMELLGKEVRKLGNVSALFDELKVCRLLKLYRTTTGEVRRKFFQRLKSEFSRLSFPANLTLLTPAEYREFRILKRSSFLPCECFYGLQRIYGWVRSRYVI